MSNHPKKLAQTLTLCGVLSLSGLVDASIGFLPTGKAAAADFFGWMASRDASGRLARQRSALARRMETDVPRAKAELTDNLKQVLNELGNATQTSTRAWLMDELRLNIRCQLALPVYQDQCREALIRLDSMIRRVRQDEYMPDGMLREYDQSIKLVERLTEGGVLERVGGIDVSERQVEEKMEDLLLEHDENRQRKPLLPPIRQYGRYGGGEERNGRPQRSRRDNGSLFDAAVRLWSW